MDHWIELPAPDQPVEPAFRGVWRRTLLESPQGRDTTTSVHWLQTEGWHADLRVPAGREADTPANRAHWQGFFGITRIEHRPYGFPPICTWQRHWDVQPPRSTPDAGTVVFDTPDRLIEYGVHGHYLEVWERLPGSQGPCRAEQERDAAGQPTGRHRFSAGPYTLLVRARRMAWPASVAADTTLAELVQQRPEAADDLLDFSMRLFEH
ncbi:hypothetical protein [uncultured Hydrogenophaga sp.]|uniref:hypothetical protein n=1 Tax=uncultured Hydrogenophaga sp. TaxID=199683 RepID=UPI00265F6211|nr:hypothetical protein [uncultured Hydrogenophaga sp.]